MEETETSKDVHNGIKIVLFVLLLYECILLHEQKEEQQNGEWAKGSMKTKLHIVK